MFKTTVSAIALVVGLATSAFAGEAPVAPIAQKDSNQLLNMVLTVMQGRAQIQATLTKKPVAPADLFPFDDFVDGLNHFNQTQLNCLYRVAFQTVNGVKFFHDADFATVCTLGPHEQASGAAYIQALELVAQ